MAFLFILFLNTNFASANEVINNFNDLEQNMQTLNVNNKKDKNNLFFKEVTLKDIPKTKVSVSERKELRVRNPFFPAGSENLNTKSGVNFSDISFKGIAKIGDEKMVFMETKQGTNSYGIGQILGGGYKISNIDEKKLIVEISNQSTTHTIKLEKDEK